MARLSELELIQYAQSKNIYTATSTNAHYLGDKKLPQQIGHFKLKVVRQGPTVYANPIMVIFLITVIFPIKSTVTDPTTKMEVAHTVRHHRQGSKTRMLNIIYRCS